MNQKFGEKLRELRGKMTLRDVAKLTGLSHTYIRDLELGNNRKTNKPPIPSRETLRKLSEAYDHPYGDLLEYSGYFDGLSDDKKKQLKEAYNDRSKVIESFRDLLSQMSINGDYPEEIKVDLIELMKSTIDDEVMKDSLFDFSNITNELIEMMQRLDDFDEMGKLYADVIKIAKKHELDIDYSKLVTTGSHQKRGNQMQLKQLDDLTWDLVEMTDEEAREAARITIRDVVKALVGVVEEHSGRKFDLGDITTVGRDLEMALKDFPLTIGEVTQNKELTSLLNEEEVTYKHQPLNAPDRQRILDMLKVLFPDRQ
ncbi:helix-turn-helix domain-containing protein [Cohnella herbarum]|uniref:Helix-turn-helix transcriptional regulator n=1 Tax=Cohnella herbarum TaxID=2728023 RepID=A0A7Z2VR04_9BACL|nr:helix-turn-helix transcriptional regulator [Cohnella herbarum]QJD87586.1 helix-turn-helix transcriptional regulator [Cohnella herbarum]